MTEEDFSVVGNTRKDQAKEDAKQKRSQQEDDEEVYWYFFLPYSQGCQFSRSCFIRPTTSCGGYCC